jgi:hypothetical protein
MSLDGELRRCVYAVPDPEHGCDHCKEMDVPCTGSFADVNFGPSEQDCFEPLCLWEIYQSSQSYENCCRWLKHQAFCRLTEED